MHSLGVRVLKNVKTRGALTNFNQVKELIVSKGEDIFKRVSEFYYIGQNNILLGAAMTDCYLMIRMQTLTNILKYNSFDTAKEAIKAVFTAYDKLNQVFQKMNIRDAEDQLHPIILNRIYSVALRDKRLIPSSRKNADEVDYFTKKIKKIIKHSFEELTAGTSFGIKNRPNYIGENR